MKLTELLEVIPEQTFCSIEENDKYQTARLFGYAMNAKLLNDLDKMFVVRLEPNDNGLDIVIEIK